jgi:toxin ParE1/3/4
MAEVIWTSPALDDLNNIAEYIALSHISAANKLVQKVFDKISKLENNPEPGKKPQELVNLNYREVNVNPCRIFYKVYGDKVYILHVMRQEREFRKFLLQS